MSEVRAFVHCRRVWNNREVGGDPARLVVWDVDGTLIPADLRWLRRALARTYRIPEAAVVFPAQRVHGYTDESIAVDAAICSGVHPTAAEEGIPRFREMLVEVMAAGRDELARDQAAYPGAADTIAALHEQGFMQTVLTGNLRAAAEVKLTTTGLHRYLDLDIGGFGSDARDRFALPRIVAQRFESRYECALDPRRTIIIGDAPNDIACARYAGFCVAVVAHRLGREQLAEHHPDAILDQLSPQDVVSVVRSLTQPPPSA